MREKSLDEQVAEEIGIDAMLRLKRRDLEISLYRAERLSFNHAFRVQCSDRGITITPMAQALEQDATDRWLRDVMVRYTVGIVLALKSA